MMRWTQLRSLAVSLVTTALDLALFALSALSLAGAALTAARWICSAVGAACNFALNRCWAFGARRGGMGGQAARYALTSALAVTLATALWWLLVRLTGLDIRLLHLLSLAAVWPAFTYPVMRRWVFANRPAA